MLQWDCPIYSTLLQRVDERRECTHKCTREGEVMAGRGPVRRFCDRSLGETEEEERPRV